MAEPMGDAVVALLALAVVGWLPLVWAAIFDGDSIDADHDAPPEFRPLTGDEPHGVAIHLPLTRSAWTVDTGFICTCGARVQDTARPVDFDALLAWHVNTTRAPDAPSVVDAHLGRTPNRGGGDRG